MGLKKSRVFIFESFDLTEIYKTNREFCLLMPVVNEFNVCNSNYELFSAILFTTGNNVHFYSNRIDKISFSTLAILKSSIMSSESTIKKFETPTVRGYVFTLKNAVVVSFFDKSDTHYELTFSSNISQSEIDYVLSTINTNWLKQTIFKHP